MHKDSGEIWLDGQKIKISCPMDAIRHGVVLAPEDRKKDGLCTKLSIRQNLALPNLDMICNKLGVIRSAREDQLCEEAVTESADQDAECGDRLRQSFRRKPAEGSSGKVAGKKFKGGDL